MQDGLRPTPSQLSQSYPPSKRLPPSHTPVNRPTSPTHSSSSSGALTHSATRHGRLNDWFTTAMPRAHIKQDGESMFSVSGMDVTHDTVHLETITDEVSPSTPSLHQKGKGNLKGLNGDLVKHYGKKKALKVLEGQMAIEDGNLYGMSLIRAMYSTVWLEWWIAIIMKSCTAALQVTYPLITHQLIDQLTRAHAYHNDPANNPPPKSVVYSFGLAFALFAMVQASSLFSYQALQRGSVIGFMMRAALIDLIGSKSIKLSSTARVEMSSGKMMTMVSADASFLNFSAPMALDLVVQPVQIVLIAIFGVIFRDAVNASSFGVVFSYALSAAALFSSLVSLYAQVEMEMNNAERIIRYTSLPAEPPATLSSDPKIWPSHGSVKFKVLSLRYSSDAPWILKKLNFSVGPGEKVGVIGRTGEGKSSLVGAIMRTVGDEGINGQVEIDGVDIKNIGIDTLRNGVGLIPQESFLFEGTVRENMDPKGHNIDAHLKSLLSLIHSNPIMPSSQSVREKFRLDAPVSDGGNNFSGGEKQLLALMRALARNTKILLLDEATSSVDGETDALIQRIIQNHLKGVTLISIAHRLHTLAYYDRILVLDGGRVTEVDFTLLFRSIWQR
ncbi:hypothetical protein I307_04542 [Cryptococcus deuterogattii 99/473]|uniref:Unplaced genomic scaffold supercont1.3, whole genome shotgun sequence n=1 Tax=Cryptococcus deuterogattii Ram5 TaxID=1296110 RepID=A0A0D0U357_9TREE|nr:hypothetical protein I313_01805 [Cryptococcus deuterogattii Ram5]KIY56148.1 hypothetical protein I307_04542 [Cryptococcus deuterogattii 99/473]